MKASQITAYSTEEMQAVVMDLTTESCLFVVEPQCDDMYVITVRRDCAHAVFPPGYTPTHLEFELT